MPSSKPRIQSPIAYKISTVEIPNMIEGMITPTRQNVMERLTLSLFIFGYIQMTRVRNPSDMVMAAKKKVVSMISLSNSAIVIPKIISTTMLYRIVVFSRSFLDKFDFSRKSCVTEAAEVNIYVSAEEEIDEYMITTERPANPTGKS